MSPVLLERTIPNNHNPNRQKNTGENKINNNKQNKKRIKQTPIKKSQKKVV